MSVVVSGEFLISLSVETWSPSGLRSLLAAQAVPEPSNGLYLQLQQQKAAGSKDIDSEGSTLCRNEA